MDDPNQALAPNLTFVLRVWPEPEPRGQVRWRGEVLHAASGERRPFVDLRTIADFIGRWAGEPVLQPRPSYRDGGPADPDPLARPASEALEDDAGR